MLLNVNWENWAELQLLCCVFSGDNKGVNWSTIQGMSVNIVRTEVKTDEYNDKYILILIQIQQALWTENINTCVVSFYRSWSENEIMNKYCTLMYCVIGIWNIIFFNILLNWHWMLKLENVSNMKYSCKCELYCIFQYWNSRRNIILTRTDRSVQLYKIGRQLTITIL